MKHGAKRRATCDLRPREARRYFLVEAPAFFWPFCLFVFAVFFGLLSPIAVLR